MANVDGYYLVVGTKEETEPGSNPPITTILGGDNAFYFTHFKAGGKNDGETPDENVTINPIFPMSPNTPAPTEVTLDDGHGNHCEQSLGVSDVNHSPHSNGKYPLTLHLTSRHKFLRWITTIRKVGQVRQNRGRGGKCY